MKIYLFKFRNHKCDLHSSRKGSTKTMPQKIYSSHPLPTSHQPSHSTSIRSATMLPPSLFLMIVLLITTIHLGKVLPGSWLWIVLDGHTPCTVWGWFWHPCSWRPWRLKHECWRLSTPYMSCKRKLVAWSSSLLVMVSACSTLCLGNPMSVKTWR